MESDPMAELKKMILQLTKSFEEKKIQDDERHAQVNSRLDKVMAHQNAWDDGTDVLFNPLTPNNDKGLDQSKQKREVGSTSDQKRFVLVNTQEKSKEPIDNTAVPPKDIYKGEIDKLKARVERIDSTDDASLSDILAFNGSAPMPIGFTMPTIEKFDGTGPPRAHLSTYSLGMKAQGANEEMAARFFQLTLRDSALTWYLQQDPADRMNWEFIGKAFYKQYECNRESEVTRRDLEALRQEPREAFSEYVARWRRKAAQMVQRPAEEEQVQMVVKSLISGLNQHLFSHYFPSFKQLMIAGGQVEDALNEKNKEANRARGSDRNNRASGVNAVGFGPAITGTTDSINLQDLFAMNTFQRRSTPRVFDDFDVPLSKLFLKLKEKGLLIALNPRPPPQILPKWWDASKHCIFHQCSGHDTENCAALRHKIQDLIDAGKITKPSPATKPTPNITTNPLPNHQDQNVSFLSLEGDPTINVSTLITPISQPKPWTPYITLDRLAGRCNMISLENLINGCNEPNRSGLELSEKAEKDECKVDSAAMVKIEDDLDVAINNEKTLSGDMLLMIEEDNGPKEPLPITCKPTTGLDNWSAVAFESSPVFLSTPVSVSHTISPNVESKESFEQLTSINNGLKFAYSSDLGNEVINENKLDEFSKLEDGERSQTIMDDIEAVNIGTEDCPKWRCPICGFIKGDSDDESSEEDSDNEHTEEPKKRTLKRRRSVWSEGEDDEEYVKLKHYHGYDSEQDSELRLEQETIGHIYENVFLPMLDNTEW